MKKTKRRAVIEMNVFIELLKDFFSLVLLLVIAGVFLNVLNRFLSTTNTTDESETKKNIISTKKTKHPKLGVFLFIYKLSVFIKNGLHH